MRIAPFVQMFYIMCVCLAGEGGVRVALKYEYKTTEEINTNDPTSKNYQTFDNNEFVLTILIWLDRSLCHHKWFNHSEQTGLPWHDWPHQWVVPLLPLTDTVSRVRLISYLHLKILIRVPQGSLLGPLLLSLRSNEIVETRNNLRCVYFVYDNILCISRSD